MPFLFASLVIAMVFGISVHTIYGVEMLVEPWVDKTFWWIIGTGVAIAGTKELLCVFCRQIKHQFSGLCAWKPCAQI